MKKELVLKRKGFGFKCLKGMKELGLKRKGFVLKWKRRTKNNDNVYKWHDRNSKNFFEKRQEEIIARLTGGK